MGRLTEHDDWAATSLTLERFERLLAGPYPDDEFYGWEPLPLRVFLDLMREVKAQIGNGSGPRADGRFLEVGCGVGTKLVLARMLGWEDVTGIELRSAYAEVARQTCPEATVIETDATSWDGYGEFDVIYCYRPCIDNDAEQKLEQCILSNMKPGAVLACHGLTKPEVRRV